MIPVLGRGPPLNYSNSGERREVALPQPLWALLGSIDLYQGTLGTRHHYCHLAGRRHKCPQAKQAPNSADHRALWGSFENSRGHQTNAAMPEGVALTPNTTHVWWRTSKGGGLSNFIPGLHFNPII